MSNEFGYTTGTYAAAAVKAALSMLLNKKMSKKIEITLPDNGKANIPVNDKIPFNIHFNKEKYGELSEINRAASSVIKKSVENADVTHNMEIIAQVSFRQDNQIKIDGGPGVGRITKPGLQLPVGEAAINPVPRKMISSAVRELTDRGVNIIISVPKGNEIAAKTTNARLGIVGGISIIGTTGIMKPKSLASFKQTIFEQLKFCKKNGFGEIIITPGNISEKAMQKHFGDKLQPHQMIQSGDFLGFTLKHAAKMNLSFLLAGHPGKLAKTLTGHFQTHYTRSPSANKAVINLIKNKIESNITEELEESTTVEGMLHILNKYNKSGLFNMIAEEIEKKIQSYLKTNTPVPILLFNMNKDLIGYSNTGAQWINQSP